jgi:hypothetical protein
MVVKHNNILHYKAIQNIPEFGFLVRKNKPSGNPGSERNGAAKMCLSNIRVVKKMESFFRQKSFY